MGAIMTCVCASKETTVATAVGEVHNVGLMQDRLIGVLIGLAVAIAGVIMTIAQHYTRTPVEESEPWK
jgi:hypothetical protein